MTNEEKFKDEIVAILFKTGKHPALINERLTECHIDCRSCKFYQTKWSCDEAFVHWCAKEVPDIDWSRVPVDTKILVRDSKNDPWRKAHFAKVHGRLIVAFSLGKSSWTVLEDNTFSVYLYADIPDPEERKKYLKNE